MKSEIGLIALGANVNSTLGGPLETLKFALKLLKSWGIHVIRVSKWRSTPAFPAESGPDFVNGAAAVKCNLTPFEILEALHAVENEVGRERRKRWGPRVCDLDLLALGERVLPSEAELRRWIDLTGEAAQTTPETLLLPHPRMHERGFVLAPLADIAPDWRHPILGRTVTEMLADLPPEALEGIEVI
ncbi:MAG: 2-amino-4-hydroxy-6-hydroxymethyldihydropteridine diphosphokinase [Pseudomonadota bacterium]